MTKVASLVLLNHLSDPSVCQNVSEVLKSHTKFKYALQISPRMDEPVEHLSCLLDEVGLVGVVLQLIVGLQVKDHVESLPVVRHLLVQPSEVELVLRR